MTIQTEDRKAGPFPGDGVTVNFDFGFKVFAETDVLVIQAVTATGAETEKTITTDYTVTLNPNQESSPGGRVTMLVAPPAGQTITLTSEVPNLQGKTITSLGGFFPQVLNDALDRLTVLVQQVRRDVARSVKVNLSSTTTPDQLLADINTAVLSTAADVETATTQAGIATTQAGIATTQAGIATTQAGIATTQAGIATTQANAAAGSASTAASAAAAAATAALTTVAPPGLVASFAMSAAPSGWLKCNGSAINRATYSNLFAAIVKSSAVTISIASPGVVTWNSHGRIANDPVKFTTTGALPTGLIAGTTYYVVGASITTNTFQVSATPGGAAINTSGSQSGTHTAIHAPFGDGDGSTTFNVPDLRGEFLRALDDGRGIDTARAIGSAQTDMIKAHAHTFTNTQSPWGGPGPVNGYNVAGTGSTDSFGGAETRPRNVAMLACIKF